MLGVNAQSGSPKWIVFVPSCAINITKQGRASRTCLRSISDIDKCLLLFIESSWSINEQRIFCAFGKAPQGCRTCLLLTKHRQQPSHRSSFPHCSLNCGRCGVSCFWNVNCPKARNFFKSSMSESTYSALWTALMRILIGIARVSTVYDALKWDFSVSR